MIFHKYGQRCWLVAQIAHARLAADIARLWGNSRIEKLFDPQAVLPAIAHHDDGWRLYDQQLPPDSRTGRLLDFMDLPMTRKQSMWEESILSASRSQAGIWGGLWVSGHFYFLANRTRQTMIGQTEVRQDRAELAAYEDFLKRQIDWTSRCQAELLNTVSSTEFEIRRQAGIEAVQFFDYVSLWLCQSDGRRPLTLTLNGVDFTWQRSQTNMLGPVTIEVKPYPFVQEHVHFEVEGIDFPVRFLNSKSLHHDSTNMTYASRLTQHAIARKKRWRIQSMP